MSVLECSVLIGGTAISSASGETVTPYSHFDYTARGVDNGTVLNSLSLPDGIYTVGWNTYVAGATTADYLGMRLYVDGVAQGEYGYLWGSGTSYFSQTLELTGGGTHLVQARVIDDQLGSAMVYRSGLDVLGYNAVPELSAFLALASLDVTGALIWSVRRRRGSRQSCRVLNGEVLSLGRGRWGRWNQGVVRR